MENLNKDILIYLAFYMDMPTLLNYCLVSKRFNSLVCGNNMFWKNKLNKDYPSTIDKFSNNSNFKDIYISLINRTKNYYQYVIDTEDNNIQTPFDYLKRYGNLNTMKLKIFKTSRKSNINSFEVTGNFPPDTKLWITNGIGFLTKEEAMEEFNKNNCLKYYVEDDFVNSREEFVASTGSEPEEIYGFNYDEAPIHYRKRLEEDSAIAHPSYEDCIDFYILKEIVLP